MNIYLKIVVRLQFDSDMSYSHDFHEVHPCFVRIHTVLFENSYTPYIGTYVWTSFSFEMKELAVLSILSFLFF